MKKKYLLFGLLSTMILSIGAVVAANSKRDVLQMTFADTETYKLNTIGYDGEVFDGGLTSVMSLDGKVTNKFEYGVIGSTSLVDENRELHVSVTETGDLWNGAAIINTGISLEHGKTYAVSFTTSEAKAGAFEVVMNCDNSVDKWLATLNTPLGKSCQYVSPSTAEKAGTLYICVQFGNVINEVVFRDLRVKETSNPVGEAFYGSNGYHFNVLANDGSDAWHVKLWHNGYAVTNGETYTIHVDFDVLGLQNTEKLKLRCVVTEKTSLSKDYQEFEVGDNQTFDSSFVANANNPNIEIQFGDTIGAFEVVVKRITVTGTELSHDTFLESPYDFAQRWNTANAGAALCTANDADVKALLRLYADLAPWVRDDLADAEKYKANNVEAYPQFNDSSLASSVNYFAGKLNIIFA